MASKLTAEGQRDFARLEKVIREGLQTFVEVGSALAEIKERHLYKDVCSTFESYVQIRWGFSRQKAYQQIAAAETAKLLTTGVDTQPSSEFVVRPIATLPKEERVAAWEEAKEAAKAEGKKKPTHVHTTAAVKARRAEKKKAPEPIPGEGDGSTGGSATSGGVVPVGESPAPLSAQKQQEPEVMGTEVAPAPAYSEEVPESGTVAPALGTTRYSIVAECVARLDAPPKVEAPEYRLAYHVLTPEQTENARAWHRFLGTLLLQMDIERKKGAAA